MTPQNVELDLSVCHATALEEVRRLERRGYSVQCVEDKGCAEPMFRIRATREQRVDLKRVLMELGNALVRDDGYVPTQVSYHTEFDRSQAEMLPIPHGKHTDVLTFLTEWLNRRSEAREKLSELFGIDWPTVGGKSMEYKCHVDKAQPGTDKTVKLLVKKNKGTVEVVNTIHVDPLERPFVEEARREARKPDHLK